MIRPPPRSTLIPYPTLCRSVTRDAHAYVFHDATLDRLTDATGPVARHASGELDRIRLSATAETIPSLSEVLGLDRKSTRLNSSHANISYAAFCLTKKLTH